MLGKLMSKNKKAFFNRSWSFEGMSTNETFFRKWNAIT